MNIYKDSAGCVTGEHILSVGFEVFDTIKGNDMGMAYAMPQYQNQNIQIVGGYWSYTIKERSTGKKLWDGWWNSNDEFDKTMAELGALA